VVSSIQIDLHEQNLQQSDAAIEDKSETSSVNEEFYDSNNSEDIAEHF